MSQLHYTQLSRDERIIIANRLKNGDSMRQIANSIDRSPSTISRELKRNGMPPDAKTTRVNRPRIDNRHYRGQDNQKYKLRSQRYQLRVEFFKCHSVYRYGATKADRLARNRKSISMHSSHPPKLQLPENGETLTYVKEKLALRWSPEQIDLRLKLESGKQVVSYKTIYNYVYSSPELIKCLRRKGTLAKRRRSRTIFNQTDRLNHSIHNRPAIVEELSRLGDLEGDTIVGKSKKDRIVTHVDRVSGVLSMGLVLEYDSGKITTQSAKDIKRVFGEIHTVTYDNGVEFSNWRETEKKINGEIYFADAYTPSQRGRNENANGLIRDFLPKGTDFAKLTQADIIKIESLINNRPRKRFGGKTPLEMSVALNYSM